MSCQFVCVDLNVLNELLSLIFLGRVFQGAGVEQWKKRLMNAVLVNGLDS